MKTDKKVRLQDWLNETTANDLMVQDIHSLNQSEPLSSAAEVFLVQQISGAPVVDDGGLCVGVISVTDIVGAERSVEEELNQLRNSSFWSSDLILPESVYEDKLSEVRDKIAPAGEQPIQNFMSENLVSVNSSDSLGEVVQLMVASHVHRVIVVDDDNLLRGLISSTDVLSALSSAHQHED